MAPNETAEQMTHLRRTYDPKSLEHDTPSHLHPDGSKAYQHALDTKQPDPPRSRRLDQQHTNKAKTPNLEETGNHSTNIECYLSGMLEKNFIKKKVYLHLLFYTKLHAIFISFSLTFLN